MSDIAQEHRVRPTTQAAEGLPRLKWTVAELDRMLEAGIFTEDDRIELIGGELVPMSPKGIRHEIVKTELLNWLFRRLPSPLNLAVELGWRPNSDTYLEPDLVIYPGRTTAALVPAEQILLVIEVAQSSLSFDTGTKAATYARLGVRDYWVVNAVTLDTDIHRTPGPNGFADVKRYPASHLLTPSLVPVLAFRLADIGIA
jgi:Uma2 family endonuclease